MLMINTHAFLKILITVLVSSVISSCGFQLKGHNSSSQSSLDTIKLSVTTAPPFIKPVLIKALHQAGVSVDNNSTNVLTINRYEHKAINLSLEARNDIIERQLISQLAYTFTSADKQVQLNTASAQEVYTHNPLQVAASDREQQELEQLLAMRLAKQIVRHIAHQ